MEKEIKEMIRQCYIKGRKIKHENLKQKGKERKEYSMMKWQWKRD